MEHHGENFGDSFPVPKFTFKSELRDRSSSSIDLLNRDGAVCGVDLRLYTDHRVEEKHYRKLNQKSFIGCSCEPNL